MKIGDYVRTNNGGIGKIINCPFKTMYLDEIWGDIEDTEKIITNNIYKSSSNIIDLIEVGDYVNGMQVTRICFDEDGERILNLSNCILELMNEDIKTIVTKEQFESIEYMVTD